MLLIPLPVVEVFAVLEVAVLAFLILVCLLPQRKM